MLTQVVQYPKQSEAKQSKAKQSKATALHGYS
jgi:hypothetical protein